VPKPLIWACRVFGYAWSFLLTCTAAARAHDAGGLHALVAGYAVIGAVMAVWAVLDVRRGTSLSSPASSLSPTRLAWLLGVICGVAGLLSATHEGTLSVLPAGIAALVAGGDCALGQALAVAGAGVLGVAAGAIGSGNTQTALLVGLIASVLSGLMLGRHRRAYRVQAVQATELLERTRELQVQQRRADVLDERTRIAREIHDVLAHSLGSLSIQIQAARAVLADDGDRETVLDVLADAQRLATGGLAETRRALHALRADAFSLEHELRALAASHEELHHAPVEVEVQGAQGELDPAAAMTLLRVAQESLVNAAKHAPGESVDLELCYAETDVRLTARNPLPATVPVAAAPTPTLPSSPTSASSLGALSTADSGYGLPGMRERLLLADGTLEAGPRGATWHVEAVLPHTPVVPTTAPPFIPSPTPEGPPA
jgi:signal transduction histidine kinase